MKNVCSKSSMERDWRISTFEDALKKFAIELKLACDDEYLLTDLFLKADFIFDISFRTCIAPTYTATEAGATLLAALAACALALRFSLYLRSYSCCLN